MSFRLLGEVTDIEVIARGLGVRERKRLFKSYGRGRWRKLKGIATVEYVGGGTCVAEIHWYEAHGIGQRELKVKRVLRVL